MSTITKNFDKVWLQERSLIFVTATNGATYCDLYNGTTRLARYTLNADHKVTIDITDYMRAYPSVTALKVQIAGETAQTISTVVGGRINPEHLLAPEHGKIGWLIAPPSMMLKDIGISTIFECYGYDETEDCEFTPNGQAASAIARSNSLPIGCTSVDIAESHDVIDTIRIRPLECGVKYAAVEWVSASGVTRRHTFGVKDVKSSFCDTFSLSTIDGSYDTRKGRIEALSLFLEGLTAYDLWYYSDIITSSSVKVSLDGNTWRQVDVTTNSVTIPNGDAGDFNKLTIAVNYRKYDAV